jgi:hypothetical protein
MGTFSEPVGAFDARRAGATRAIGGRLDQLHNRRVAIRDEEGETMSKMIRVRVALAAAVCGLGASLASAGTLTFQYTGTITYASPRPDGRPWVPVGTQVTGTWSYDPDTQGSATGPLDGPGMADYDIQIRKPMALTASFGDHELVSAHTGITLFNDWQSNVQDMVWIASADGVRIDDRRLANARLDLTLASDWQTYDALTSLALPTSYDFAKFNAPGFDYGYFENDGDDGTTKQVVEFSIDSVTNPPAASR